MSSNNNSDGAGSAQSSSGISLVAFLTALATALVVFGVQMGFFLLLRNKLARIFKPKTFLVPERERTEPPPVSPWGLIHALLSFKDREIIEKCGLDAYFFMRYLQTLMVIFVPIALVVIPVLVPINYCDGIGQSFAASANGTGNSTGPGANVTGLDTLAWGNVKPVNANRHWAHLVMAVLVVAWVCYVSFAELRVYIKIRQDYLTTPEHRLRASANTVMMNSIPDKWLTEPALRGLFDAFPGGIRNIWITRDFGKLLDKINTRNDVHARLESAETELIRTAKRKADKKARKEARLQSETKAERAQRQKEEDARARRRAAAGGGASAGDHERVPHQVSTYAEDDRHDPFRDDADHDADGGAGNDRKDRRVGAGRARIGQGIGGFGKAGQGLVGSVKKLRSDVDGDLDQTGGFEIIQDDDGTGAARAASPPAQGSDRRGVRIADDVEKPRMTFASEAGRSYHAHNASVGSQDTAMQELFPPQHRNTVRTLDNPEDLYTQEETRWWQFWKPPSGAYASPVPQVIDGGALPLRGKKDGGDEEPVDYPSAFNEGYKEEELGRPVWEKWVEAKDRPTHRLPLFGFTPAWLPGLPFVNKKVDTIYWCREELARLNVEIEEDQKHPEKYPVMASAFIQFNSQVAAHMACQSVAHHVPNQMAPRVVEVDPNDVIWANMAVRWWEEWARTVIVLGVVTGMVILWAFPVAWTSSLSQVDALVKQYSWLGFLETNQTVYNAVKAVAGVLPALVLSILLAIVPMILAFLAEFQGAKTGSQRSEAVQSYYFIFLFVQVFLVVSITSGTFQVLQGVASDVTSIPQTLADNLPKAADYFFSYMILQALSTSSGTLLQIGTLLVWFVLARILDSTARDKWARNTQLPDITWGSYFPVYTNFACIALIYSVIAPIISIFAIITFSLLWVANRYNMLYVIRFKTDTGGVLYPRAINQTFTGLYVMELCLIGLFFLVQDQNGDLACTAQAIIMIVVLILTLVYQYLMNRSIGPLLRYLPITYEDEAVLRDEVFRRAQERRMGLIDADDDDDDDEASSLNAANGSSTYEKGNDIELRKLGGRGRTGTAGRLGKLNPVKGIVHAGTWAARGGRQITAATLGRAEGNLRSAALYRQQRRQKDLEAQRAVGDALYGGYQDDIEDLTPEERDALVRKAFTHYALRARRPAVWIPHDDMGVSDDEIRRTLAYSDHVWISNEGTALDSKARVVYGRNPPDFSDVDLINL